MPTVTSATKHWPTAKEGFTTTLASTIISGATTVPLNSVAGYTNGATVVLVIEPTSATLKQAFTGVVDTAGVQITNVVWTEGTNASHTAGVTVVDYETATHWALYSKGLLVEHNQDGTHSDITATTVTADEFIVTGSAGANNGWEVGLPTPDTVTYNGNRSYDLVFNSNDLTDTLSNGMRTRFTRTVTPPTQCTDLEASSSQYWSKTSPAGISFTTTFTCSAWIKLESYTLGGIIARRNADTEGWSFYVDANGLVNLSGLRIAANNKSIQSYQSIPLNKWVHVAACMDMTAGDTTAQKIWIDGVEVPRSYTLTGTATALVQGTTALVVGARKSAGTDPFDGKIAQASVHSACLSDAQIKAMASQTISSSTPSIVSGFTFNGAATDVSANANDLSASGGATYGTDSPFNSTEYGIITKNAFSTDTTLTVQVPEGYAIPTSGGISAVAYSTQSTPYGFPADKGKWEILTLGKVDATQTATGGTWYNLASHSISIPTGAWDTTYKAMVDTNRSTATSQGVFATLSTANNTESDSDFTSWAETGGASGTILTGGALTVPIKTINTTTATTYYLNEQSVATSAASGLRILSASYGQSYIKARLTYV